MIRNLEQPSFVPLSSDWLSGFIPDGIATDGPENANQIGDITAAAFENDPVNQWMFRRVGGMRSTFKIFARDVYGPHGICHRIGDEAAAMWMVPGGPKNVPNLSFPALVSGIMRYGGPIAMNRVLAFDKAAKKAAPETANIYLFTVGVRPQSQGQGLGRRLLSPVLKACDAAGLPAYLENSNPANHGFYTSLGFEPRGSIVPAKNAPPLEAMWRAPRSQ